MKHDDIRDDDDDETVAPCCISLADIKRIVGGLQAMDRDDVWRRTIDDRSDLEEDY